MNYNTILPPFKWFVLENFPYIEDDFDALTNWQLFCKLGKEMNKIIEKCNLTGEQVENLTNAYNELKAYVDNYFENLDLQEEVDHKLDEMAESGELADLIAQYLESQAIIGFNTCSALAGATNLANGSFARTLGRNSYSDGYGAFYKIRTRINTDDPDGYNLIVLTETENLVAEKLGDANLNAIADRVTAVEGDITTIEGQISNITTKKWLVIGDSYSQGYSPDGNTSSWSVQLQTLLGLDNNHYSKHDYGGASFGNSGAYLYNTILQGLDDDSTVTDILIAGGYNDITISKTNIVNGIATVKTTCASKFPNAKIHCAFIGGTMLDHHGQIHLAKTYYEEGFNAYQIDYYPNLEYIMYSEENFASDGIHPNQSGQTRIARGLYQAINGEFSYSKFADLTIKVADGNMFAGNDIPLHLYSNNNTTYLSHYSGVTYLNSSSFNLPTDRYLNIGKIQSRYGVVGTQYYSNMLLDIGNVIIHATGGYYNCPCRVTIDKDSIVKLYILPMINDSHNNYQAIEGITQVQLPNFTMIYPTDVL